MFKRFPRRRSLGEIIRHPFRFQWTDALTDICLNVESGKVLGLLGPNGAGKTTLLRILATSVLPDSGSARILGLDIAKDTQQVKPHIGFVLSDERSFFWRLTARQNLRFFATLANLDNSRIPLRIAELSELLQIASELDKPFRNLSSGMRQRLALARALLHDPKVLLIDEPTRGLDPGSAKTVRQLIRQTLGNELGKTILLATHNLQEARVIADRLALLCEGKLQAEEPTEQGIQRATDLFGLEGL